MSTTLSPDQFDALGAREILNALADGAYITDLDRRIVFWNQAAKRIVGWEPTEVVGHTCFDNILVHTDKDGHPLCGQEHCPLHRSIVTGTPSTEPVLVFARHRDGRRIPVEVTVAPVLDRDGHILGGIEVFRDLTELFNDLGRARRIQAQALDAPASGDERLKVDVRYTPADIVGGDFYRMERIAPDRHAVLIADVMGHGVASALYSMQLRSLWDEYRSELAEPARFLDALNRRLRQAVQPEGYFATALVAVLELDHGLIRYVRAGHPSPFLISPQQPPRRLAPHCAALGLFDDSRYRESIEHWKPGDELFLFTDGAVEIASAADKDLGENGLLRLFTQCREKGGDCLQALEEELLVYGHGIHLDDDLTLIRIQWRPG